MAPPFEVSIFADPSGAITTAAAMVACVEVWVKNISNESLEGKTIHVLGGTGPVGVVPVSWHQNAVRKFFLVAHEGKRSVKL